MFEWLFLQGIGIGYVEFADDSYVSEAIALNGSQLAKRPVRVERCHKSGKTDKNRKATVGRSAKRQKMGGDRSTRGNKSKKTSSGWKGAEASTSDDISKFKKKKKKGGHGQKKKGKGKGAK